MRLKGIGHYSKATDNADLYVELAQLAVLVGPNDSGKTRTLFAVDEALRQYGPWLGDVHAPSPTPGHDFHYGVFVELDDNELFAACNTCLDALLADADLDPSAWGLFSFRELQDYDPAWIDAGSQLQGPGAVQTWFDLVRRSWGLTDDRFDAVFRALAESRLAQVREDVGGSLNLSLALSPDIANSNCIADLLDEIGYEEDHPAPTPLLPLPLRSGSHLPRPLSVPTPTGEAVERELLNAIAGLLPRGAATDDEPDGLPPWAVEVDRDPADPSVQADLVRQLTSHDQNPYSISVSPEFRALCDVAEHLVNAALPQFVCDSYRVRVAPRVIAEWVAYSPLDVAIESAHSDPPFHPRRFKLDQAAGGFQVWLQLAVLIAAGSLRAARYAAGHGSATIQRALGGFLSGPLSEDARAGFLRTVRALTASANSVDHCYIIDEPERHLHPRVVRQAAAWLQSLVAEHGAQCVIATHAWAFTDLGDAASYTHLDRDNEGHVTARAISPEEFHEPGAFARAMGFDRGEMLSNIQDVLFVEGVCDKIVFDTLFRSDLRNRGIKVVPLHGARNAPGAVDAEFFARDRSDVRMWFLFDNRIGPTVARLYDDDELLDKARYDKKIEVRAAASVIKTARAHGQKVTVLSIEAEDIFFELDEGVIVELFPRYKGHEQARAAWLADTALNPDQKTPRKKFSLDACEIPDTPETFERIATLMKQRNSVPEALDGVLYQIVGPRRDV